MGGPPDGSNNFLSEQISKQQKNNFHSTSLTSGPIKMVGNSVNKTALHPGGVAPQNEHTEIGEELHERAHIDYDRVSIIANPSVPALYEDALVYETGSAMTSTGALTAYSGTKTGRSPSDKRVVKEPGSEKDVWWGPVNKEMSPEVWKINRERAVDYLNTRNRIYVIDGYAGWDERYRINVRVVCARAYHALFMRNMLIRPERSELQNFHPDYVIYNAGSFPANRFTTGMTSSTSVAINFAEKEMVILGTEYAGEMKKGIFTVLFYEMPVKHNVLTLHSSANEGKSGDVTVFFGLSGTGKTTLSADPKRALIGDDEHCWSDRGVFNIEGGCYAKCIGLSAEKEPDISNAIKFGSILENTVFDPVTRVVDYDDSTLTENTRCAYPIEYIENTKIPCISTNHPTNIVLLTCDARGVLPPISKLNTEQTMFHFISGYTSKMAGTEEGVTEPQATFSSCFAPFPGPAPDALRQDAGRQDRPPQRQRMVAQHRLGRCWCYYRWQALPTQVHPRHPRRHPQRRARQGRLRDLRRLQPVRAEDLHGRARRAPQPQEELDRHRRLHGRGHQARPAVPGQLQEVRGRGHPGGHQRWSAGVMAR